MILQINDKSFNVGTINLSRQWDIEEKYRVTTESGTKLREVRGVYKKYTLNLRNIDDTTYNDLIEELTNGADVSTVTLPYGKDGTVTFEAFFSKVSDELVKTIGNIHHWDNLSLEFEARKI